MATGDDLKYSIRLFASLKERVGASQISVEITQPATVSELLDEVVRLYPGIQPYLKTTLISVNREFASRSQPISQGDEIALFPPVSGG